jgi:outer membrane protein assembly factor BamB
MNMRNKYLLVLLALPLCGWMALAQSRGGNWPTFAGDAQRSGWQGADAAIKPETIKDMQLLWKLKLETAPKGSRPITPPVILGRLISYRGFRELGFVATNADIAYSLDVDLGTIFWTKHLEYSVQQPQITASSARCPGGLSAMPTMSVPGRPAAAARGAAGVPPVPGQRGSAFIGGPASVYAISSDGRLHRLNTSTGDDMTQPISVIPANARATNLMMIDSVIYTTTAYECGGAPNAVWAIDLSVDPVKVRSYPLNANTGWTNAGTTLGSDNTVYVRSSDRLLALRPRELQLKDYFLADAEENAASPVVLPYESGDVIVTECGAGAVCLLDANSLGGSAHNTPMFKTPPLGRSVSGALASWQEMDGTRWILAPTPNSVVALKVRDQGGKKVLETVWTSRDMSSPMPPVVASGVVFALSGGTGRATLYALDARTGKELYSSKNLVPVAASQTGLTVAGGRVYFGGVDGSFYAFGMYMEH